jgi:hypothetical protein
MITPSFRVTEYFEQREAEVVVDMRRAVRRLAAPGAISTRMKWVSPELGFPHAVIRPTDTYLLVGIVYGQALDINPLAGGRRQVMDDIERLTVYDIDTD